MKKLDDYCRCNEKDANDFCELQSYFKHNETT